MWTILWETLPIITSSTRDMPREPRTMRSAPSASALSRSIDLARDLRAEVVAVHALDTAFIAFFSPELGTRLSLDRWQEEMKRTFEDEWCAALKESGVPYQTLLLEGRPAAVLRETGELLGARWSLWDDKVGALSRSCCWAASAAS
jgi:hypothetical protein